jgi:hypothetical protein
MDIPMVAAVTSAAAKTIPFFIVSVLFFYRDLDFTFSLQECFLSSYTHSYEALLSMVNVGAEEQEFPMVHPRT